MSSPSLDTLRHAAAARGGRCLSDRYAGMAAPYDFECAAGHRFRTSGTSIMHQGTWCRACAGLAPRSLEELDAAARRHGGRCLSRAYLGSRARHRFACAAGHAFETDAANVLYARSWCPHCAGNAALGLEPLIAWAQRHGGECLSTVYEGSKSKVRFRCKRRHTFAIKPYQRHGGRGWCSVCRVLEEQARQHRRLADMLALRGYELLSSYYVSSKVKVLVRCDRDHHWWTRPDRIHPHVQCGHCRARPARIVDAPKERG